MLIAEVFNTDQPDGYNLSIPDRMHQIMGFISMVYILCNISRCNYVIDKFQKFRVILLKYGKSLTRRNSSAMVYYHLVTDYGDVPLVHKIP